VQEFLLRRGVHDGCQILALQGDLDLGTALALDDAIDGCPEGSTVIVDVSHVDYISSAGIDTLLRERAVDVALVSPHGNVARLFEVVRIQRRVALFVDLDSALENLALGHGAQRLEVALEA
jgi:anti-anti-sigma factor